LLAGKEILDTLENTFEFSKEYLLIYQVSTKANKYIQKLAKELATKNSLEIIEIPSKINIMKMIFDKKYMQWTTPEQFVGYFRNAKIVLTTSFHGTAFSLIYNRPFYVFSLGDDIDNRSKELLSMVGLENRLIKRNQTQIDNNEINWSIVNKKIIILQEESRSFIKESINK